MSKVYQVYVVGTDADRQHPAVGRYRSWTTVLDILVQCAANNVKAYATVDGVTVARNHDIAYVITPQVAVLRDIFPSELRGKMAFTLACDEVTFACDLETEIEKLFADSMEIQLTVYAAVDPSCTGRGRDTLQQP